MPGLDASGLAAIAHRWMQYQVQGWRTVWFQHYGLLGAPLTVLDRSELTAWHTVFDLLLNTVWFAAWFSGYSSF
jgi:hypothetical protein